MANERTRCSDVTLDDLERRTVDRWPAHAPGDEAASFFPGTLRQSEYLTCEPRRQPRRLYVIADPLAWDTDGTRPPRWRGCFGTP